jgi:hypothetical protein
MGMPCSTGGCTSRLELDQLVEFTGCSCTSGVASGKDMVGLRLTVPCFRASGAKEAWKRRGYRVVE